MIGKKLLQPLQALFFCRKYATFLRKSDSIFNLLSSTLLEDIQLDHMTQRIVDMMVEAVDCPGGVLFLLKEKKRSAYAYTYSKTPFADFAIKDLKKDFRQHTYDYLKPVNYIGRTIKERKIFINRSLASFIAPEPSKKICDMMQKIVGFQSVISLPLINKGKVVGAIMISLFEDSISDDTMRRIQTFTNFVSTAIGISFAHKKITQQNQSLQKQNAVMRKLLKQQSDFIDVTAHELRTPLTISQLYAEVLKPSPAVKTMQFGLNRLAERVKEILYVHEHDGKKVGFNPSKVKIAKFFTEIYHNFVPTLEKEKRQFSFDNKINEEIEAEFDTSKICQVVENLLTNALKFTKENGIITFHLALDQEKLKFAVTDNGCGVPDDTKEEIFKKFRGNHSTKNKGLGLGLYLCKKIIRMHKGKIWCEDVPLKNGTAFCVEIPLKQELAKVTKSTDNEGITKFA